MLSIENYNVTRNAKYMYLDVNTRIIEFSNFPILGPNILMKTSVKYTLPCQAAVFIVIEKVLFKK